LPNPTPHGASRACSTALLTLAALLPMLAPAADEPLAKPKAQTLRDGFGTCLRAGTEAPSPTAAPCPGRTAPASRPAAPVARSRHQLLPPPPPLPDLPPPPPLPPDPPAGGPEVPDAAADPLFSPPAPMQETPAPEAQWVKAPETPQPPPPEATAETPQAMPPSAPSGKGPAVEVVVIGAESLFELSGASLRPAARQELDALATAIRAFPARGVRVIGHTDRSGPPARNLRLSRQRAEAVKAHLVARGIPAALIVAEGRGSSEPRTQPADCEGVPRARLAACLQPDRRVEVEVTR
jgi:outer membrane protein OmpA-like peptidoglycan-associated protein